MRVRHPRHGRVLDDGGDPPGRHRPHSSVRVPAAGDPVDREGVPRLHEGDQYDVPGRPHGRHSRGALQSAQEDCTLCHPAHWYVPLRLMQVFFLLHFPLLLYRRI